MNVHKRLSPLLATCVAVAIAVPRVEPASASAADPWAGQSVFGSKCASCHLATSVETKIGPGLKGLFKRRRLPSGRPATVRNVVEKIRGGGGGMPAFAGDLSDEQLTALVDYLKTL